MRARISACLEKKRLRDQEMSYVLQIKREKERADALLDAVIPLGVALSGTAGLALDSWLFLSIAFDSLAFLWGQFWGKNEAIAVGVLLTAGRRVLLPAPALSSAG